MSPKPTAGPRTYDATPQMFEALIEVAMDEASDEEAVEVALRGVRAVLAAVEEARRIGTNVALPPPTYDAGGIVWSPRLADYPEPTDREFWVVQTTH